jgi:hypothetical protein
MVSQHHKMNLFQSISFSGFMFTLVPYNSMIYILFLGSSHQTITIDRTEFRQGI